MARKMYPLEPLARVRAGKADDAKRELALAIQGREAAAKRVDAAEADRRRGEAHARAVREAERQALERGELTARNLMRQDAWEARAKEEQAQRERALAQASARETEARAKEGAAQGALAQRSAEAGVVEKDRARWSSQERHKEEAKEEEAGAEAWRPKAP